MLSGVHTLRGVQENGLALTTKPQGHGDSTHSTASSFFVMTMVMPANMLFSFRLGIPSLVLGAIVFLPVLRDPTGKQRSDCFIET
ncbi:hypothetical protein ANAEL_04132 [Anaerolineales bacterium]|nr:hypothetical protein ANAEL_04132 [Anaerolineales bacterium]